jgi:hypothetical protein
VKTVNPSPPVARKLFIVTRYDVAASTGTPSTHIWPIIAAHCASVGAAGRAAVDCSYRKVAETCRVLADVCPPQPVNCCSSRARSWSPVIVLVTRLFPNGCTVNASP